jgi:hypothetical protein
VKTDEDKNASKILIDNEQKQPLSLISTDTDVKDTINATSTHTTGDESFYQVNLNEESSTSTPTVVSGTPAVHTTN